jgi:hypothetical protein
MATFVPTVRVIVDGTPVDAANTNGPIADLTQRTQWLKDQLLALQAGTQLILRNQTIDPAVIPGTPVYLDTATDTFKPAMAEVDTTNLNQASDRAFWQGIALTASGTVGDIVIGGDMVLPPATWAAAFDTGIFAAGDIFLGGVVPGKLSTSAGTAGIYLGHMRISGEMLVRLGNPGAFLEHIHLQRFLVGSPADSAPTTPAVNTPQTIGTPDPSQQGWLPANATYFPGFVIGVQIPTGAVFGYNIQHPAETALRQVFPVLPPENAQFDQDGQVLSTDLVIINQFGIWWMDDSYGQAPWPVDYATSSTAPEITLWTTRLIAAASVVDLAVNELIAQLNAGLAADFSVTKLFTSDAGTIEIAASEGDGVTGYHGVVTLTPKAVNAARYRRGILIESASSLGDNTTGYKGIIDAEFNADLEAKHQFTLVTAAPQDTMAPVSTNGFSVGADIGLRGHRLGANVADFIDFLITGGRDLVVAPAEYRLSPVFHFAVNTAAAVPVIRNFEVRFYRFKVGSPLSSTQLVKTVQVDAQTGVPGQLQTAALGPYADVVLQQNEHILVRIVNSTGGNPLPVDTLRVVSLYYGLTEA